MTDNFWHNAAQDARNLRVARMLPDSEELTHAQVGEVIEAVRRYLDEFEITRATLARAIATNEAYLSALFNRSPSLRREKRDELVRKINGWMEEDFRHRTARRPENFVETLAAALIIEAARNIKAGRTIGVVDGSAGLGKTLTARWLAGDGDRELPGTMLVTVDQDCRAAKGLLKKIYAASKLRRNTRKRPTLAVVVERLRDSGRLLIIDQAHDLANLNAFKLIQDLHDACELPIMLLGTIDIHHYLTDDVDPQFGQLSSRIGLRLHLMEELFRTRRGRRLQWINVSQLRKIFESGKLKLHSDTLRALCEIGNFETGHLRRVKWLVRYAEAAARAQRSPEILVTHLEQALRLVKGVRCKVLVPLAEAETPGAAESAR